MGRGEIQEIMSPNIEVFLKYIFRHLLVGVLKEWWVFFFQIYLQKIQSYDGEGQRKIISFICAEEIFCDRWLH